MKALGVVSTAALFLLLATTVPAFAQDEHHEEEAKPAKQTPAAKPAQQEEKAKPAKQEEQAKPTKQQQAKPAQQEEKAKTEKQAPQAKPAKQEQQANGKAQQSHAQYARNGQKDSRGHEYTESRFGPNHYTRFVSTGGREYNGRREYSFGGYWFYAGVYPPWFYQQNVYFVMGPDGLWYAVAYGDPSLTFQVNIE